MFLIIEKKKRVFRGRALFNASYICFLGDWSKFFKFVFEDCLTQTSQGYENSLLYSSQSFSGERVKLN